MLKKPNWYLYNAVFMVRDKGMDFSQYGYSEQISS